MIQSKLFYRINHGTRRNSGPKIDDPDIRFWKNVKAENVAALFKVYQDDFEFFGYSPVKYLQELGLEELAKDLEVIMSSANI